MSSRIGNWSQTFTGARFYPLDPRPEDVRIEDIAHHLALVCRFGGACREPYSVAQHSVLVSRVVEVDAESPEHALQALLHDAAEAYVGDMVRPLKTMVPAFGAAEQIVFAAIADRFGIAPTLAPVTKWADEVALATEARDLMGGGCLAKWSLRAAPRAESIAPVDWRTAKRDFLERFAELGGEL